MNIIKIEIFFFTKANLIKIRGLSHVEGKQQLSPVVKIVPEQR